MEKSVREFIRENDLIGEGQTVGVAVSGGPDSMALLVCLCSIAPAFFYSIACVHFEHGIRGQESLDDADFVENFCAGRGIPFYMSAADVPALAEKWHVGKQSAAKRAREEYFDSLVGRGDVDVIATAHHMDDNAESVLMHLLRGSGTDGLVGVHPKYGHYIRPLLCVTRKDILAYLEEKGVGYVTDRTNAENEYTRNYVRNVLMPQIKEHVNPDAAAALNRLSVIAEYDARFIREAAEKEFDRCAKAEGDKVDIDAAALAALPRAVACRVIRLACEKLHVVRDIGNIHVISVLELAQKGRTGRRVSLSNNLYAAMEYGTLLIRFNGREVDRSFCLAFDPEGANEMPDGSTLTCEYVSQCDYDNGDPYTAYADADKLPARMMLRTRHKGDTIFPLGAPGKKKLKDYFIDRKLPREQREAAPLLADGSRIIWAVGHTIDDRCRVDENTRQVACLRYRKSGRV